LSGQIKAGVEAIQIFDSWAGVLPQLEFEAWSLRPVAAIIEGVRARHPQVKIIAFPRGAASHLRDFAARSGAQALGLDTAVDVRWAVEAIDPQVVLQGNLDPLALLAGGQSLTDAVLSILTALKGRRHIFNLGHGILPETPIAHVEHLLKLVRSEG
jgi:uroporphyrinogen decarboxylase